MQKHIRDKALGIGDFYMKTWLSSQKLRMTEDQQLIDYLLLLRFGTSDVGQAARPVLNSASISKVMRKPVSTIRDLIKRGIVSKMKKLLIQGRKRSRLDYYHVYYLCNHRTLRKWAYLSLIQRAVMFHRTFPEIKISASLL